MKDNRFEEVMQSYKESLGQSSRRTVPPRRRTMGRLALSGGAVAIAIIAGLVLWPKDAGAAAMERMTRAIKNVKTMEMRFEMDRGAGWHEFERIYYKGGLWKYLALQGTTLKLTKTVNGGQVMTDRQNFDHVTIEPMDAVEFEGYLGNAKDLSALDLAKELVDTGQVSVERKATMLGGDGKTYTVRLEREADDYRADILVDKTTDLPISVEMAVTYKLREDTVRPRCRQTYRFNLDLPDTMFELKSSKPVLHLAAEQAKLQDAWQSPLGKIEDTEVRDARVTQDGTIWIASTPASAEKLLLPSSIDAGNGVSYARTLEIVQASILGKPQTFKIDRKDLYIVAFVPMTHTVELPGHVVLKMSRRLPNLPGFSEAPNNLETMAIGTVSLQVKNELKSLPFYFPALDLDQFGLHIPVVLTDTRAKAFEKDERWLEAAKAYEECAQAYASYVKRGAQFPLKKAAQCYRKAGMFSEAVQAAGEAKRVKTLE